MTDLLKQLNNELAPQRTIALYQRQEDKIKELNEKYSLNLKLAQVAREGVDLVLAELERQLKEQEDKKAGE
jgi:hypothetical protein